MFLILSMVHGFGRRLRRIALAERDGLRLPIRGPAPRDCRPRRAPPRMISVEQRAIDLFRGKASQRGEDAGIGRTALFGALLSASMTAAASDRIARAVLLRDQGQELAEQRQIVGQFRRSYARSREIYRASAGAPSPGRVRAPRPRRARRDATTSTGAVEQRRHRRPERPSNRPPPDASISASIASRCAGPAIASWRKRRANFRQRRDQFLGRIGQKRAERLDRSASHRPPSACSRGTSSAEQRELAGAVRAIVAER